MPIETHSYLKSTGFTSSTFPIQPDFSQNPPAPQYTKHRFSRDIAPGVLLSPLLSSPPPSIPGRQNRRYPTDYIITTIMVTNSFQCTHSTCGWQCPKPAWNPSPLLVLLLVAAAAPVAVDQETDRESTNLGRPWGQGDATQFCCDSGPMSYEGS